MNDTIKDTIYCSIKDTLRKNSISMIVYLIVQKSVSYIQSELIGKDGLRIVFFRQDLQDLQDL